MQSVSARRGKRYTEIGLLITQVGSSQEIAFNRPVSVHPFPRRALTLCPQLYMGILPGAHFHARSADALPATLYGHLTQAVYRNRPIAFNYNTGSFFFTCALPGDATKICNLQGHGHPPKALGRYNVFLDYCCFTCIEPHGPKHCEL